MDNNPYMYTYAEEQSAAWTELGFAASEIGGAYLGPALRGIKGLLGAIEEISNIAANKIAGDAFRDELANLPAVRSLLGTLSECL